ncbi:MAG TPA: hypothetical protein VFR67_06405, partial [Pilimelia sp.]|nr:hypothetical protein [Pilimelia sp.]
MSTHPLPASPSLSHLRQQARALQRAVRAGDPGAAERVNRQHPGAVPAEPTGFTLSAAQLVVAREYGFPSWPRLKRHVELAAEHDETPKTDAPGEVGEAGVAGVADEFCGLACLTYTDEDDPDRWQRARQLLATDPRLTGSHVWAAAAAADPGAVSRLLDEDPNRARLPGGPYEWRPLFYLAYSRADPYVPADSVLAAARLLL